MVVSFTSLLDLIPDAYLREALRVIHFYLLTR